MYEDAPFLVPVTVNFFHGDRHHEHFVNNKKVTGTMNIL